MSLFTPLKIGNITLQNRVVLAPLTRLRASDEHVPLPFVADYYSQRGSTPGTLLISEATFIRPEAGGMKNVPGIWNQAQIDGWKVVTDAVHAKKSFIFLQLWALGRAAEESVNTHFLWNNHNYCPGMFGRIGVQFSNSPRRFRTILMINIFCPEF